MKTQVIKIEQEHPQKDVLAYAADMLKKGKLVAFPTETVYGLGANALDSNAVACIFAAKNRPVDNPLIVHIAQKEDLSTYAKHIPDVAWDLAETFWPGPLTILLERNEVIPDIVTAGSKLVSLRIPNHPVALALIKEAGIPIAAPSANSSTRPSPTDAAHVFEDLHGKVDLILDAGPTAIGLESTVLDITSHPPVILRPGGVSLEELQTVLPDTEYYEGKDLKPRAPGMKYKHYSPTAAIILYIGTTERVVEKMVSDYETAAEIITDVSIPGIPQTVQHILSTEKEYAQNMFAIFRDADRRGVEKILVKGIEEKGLGNAVMNRLKKAATDVINI